MCHPTETPRRSFVDFFQLEDIRVECRQTDRIFCGDYQLTQIWHDSPYFHSQMIESYTEKRRIIEKPAER